ncbi:MAG: DUF6916 family protein [Akkermansiaceae bacterium]
MELENFIGKEGKDYHVTSSVNKGIVLVLAEVKELESPKNVPGHIRKKPFCLIFHGRLSDGAESDLLRIKSSSGEEFQLSVNNEGPIEGDESKGFQYFAIFN